MKIIGIVGSLRKDSFNKALMETAKEVCPKEAEIEVINIGELPLFNQDLETHLPKSVQEIKNKVKTADAILIATPEHNYSVPGVLKNAIDWISRPYNDNSFDEKPVAIMSASIGMLGGSRAQYHLRQMMVFLNMYCLNRPEVMVPMAQEKIKDGKIVDEYTKNKIKEIVEALIDWTKRLNM